MHLIHDLMRRYLPFTLADKVVGQQDRIADEDAALAIPLRRRPPRKPAPAASPLSISCPDPSAEDALRDHHLSTARDLARQEDWKTLSAQIRQQDAARSLTPGGMPVAELMAYGARSDVVLAVEHALIDGKPSRGAPLLSGIEALEHVLAEHADDHVVAAIVAQTHGDLGWAWRGTGRTTQVPARNREAFAAHFERANEILLPFRDMAGASALVAGAACALLGNEKDACRVVADRYEALIDLNPANPRPMRALGNHLLPRWFGSYDALELEARRTAARTQGTWGAGGYTWVQFDAVAADTAACARLDLAFFIEGLHDILARSDDPHTINLLAAYCANATRHGGARDDRAVRNRKAIADCAEWIIREKLTELHPMIWAHAAHGFDNNLHIRSAPRFAASGREDAMRIITALFSREIKAGKRIVFTDEGPVAQPA